MFVYRTDAVNSLEMEADKNTTKKTMNKKIKHHINQNKIFIS